MKNNKLIAIIVIIVLIFIFNRQTMEKQIKKQAGETSSRSFAGNVYSYTDTTISLAINPGTSTYYVIDEKVPSGWTVKSASDSGDYTTRAGHIYWTILSGATAKTFTYVINPNENTGTQTFTGTIGFEFKPEGPIGGTTSVTVTSPSCTLDSQCPTDTTCRDYSCSGGQCISTNINEGGVCTVSGQPGTCQSGTCIQTPVYSCTGTVPSNAQLCSGDDTGLTATTTRTLVASCGTPKCEYTCSSGYQLSGGVCVSTSLCGNGALNSGEQCDGALLGGATCTSLGYTGGTLTCTASCAYNTASCTSGCTSNSQCTSYTNSCNDGTCNIGTGVCYSTPKADGTICTGGTCQSGNCVSQQTCSGLGGVICTSGQTCDGGNWVSASGTNLCCVGGTCKTPEVTCEERLKCEMWEECSDDQSKCKYASWVYLIFIFMALMFMMNMIKR